ncbi:uncharacterized protein [Choristoneura fumiferana]|uniref:uncharacterized protein n=1 Tax=Choristoneura fumiferana TaxID=7141 RepID=UPI003D1575A5
MAHRKKIELFVEVDNERDFHSILKKNADKLICAEIYCEFSGPCTALDRLFTTIKLDWSDGTLILLKVLADAIEEFERFRNHSEPVYVFIHQNKITKLFRGVDAIKFGQVAKKELYYYKRHLAGVTEERRTYNLDEATPEEEEWHAMVRADLDREVATLEKERSFQRSLRKRRRAELMVPHLQHLNFVLFWPHAKHAHFDLYERWDMNNIIMVGREELQLDEYKAKDILYAGDAPINEASLHALLGGSALAICFRFLGSGTNFATLVRRILYEDIPPLDPAKPMSDQPIQKTAFDQYKSYSPTREEIWRQRREEKMRKKEEALEKRARRLSEMQRLARQAIEDEREARRFEKEQRKLDLLKSGNLAALEELKQQPDDEEVDITVPEALSDEDEESEDEAVEDENEYFPPAGLLVPGLYAPPNDVAKANGLAILFPNLVCECVEPEPEFLPPHVLVLLEIGKRYKAIAALTPHKASIIHMGIFKGTGPSDAEHIAYSVAQYDSLTHDDTVPILLAFMVSIKSDLPLLELMAWAPAHVSRDACAGERECARLFPVHYAHPREFEDFDDTA